MLPSDFSVLGDWRCCPEQESAALESEHQGGGRSYMVGAGTVICVGAHQCGEFFAVPTYVLKVTQDAPRWWG